MRSVFGEYNENMNGHLYGGHFFYAKGDGNIIKTITEAITALCDLGFSQDEALTKLDQLIKINGTDRALALVENMEVDFYLKGLTSSIFFGNDGRYHIFISLQDGSRKHMVSKDKRNLENKIVKFCKDNREDTVKLTTCLQDIIGPYLLYKRKDASPATAYRAQSVYNRHIKDSYIATVDIDEITPVMLKEFCLEQIETCSLNSKAYRELKSLLNCMFDFAVDSGLTQVNVARQMSKINYKKFVPSNKSPETQVYSLEDESVLYSTALNMYEKTQNTAYLGIILSGCFGLRMGELVALKESDFDLERRELHVSRQEVRQWAESTNNELFHDGFVVVDYLKTKESERRLPIPESAIPILLMIFKRNDERDLSGGYLFLRDDGSRINGTALGKALRRANKNAGLPQRSNHKLRKTLLSELEHSIGATKTKAYAGHSPNSITLEKNYLYITSPLSDEVDNIDNIVSCRMPTLLESEQK